MPQPRSFRLPDAGSTMPLWPALQLGPSTLGVFDAFHNRWGRQRYLSRFIGKVLSDLAPELFAVPPSIERAKILGSKIAQELRSAA
jgi:hypothetical protein